MDTLSLSFEDETTEIFEIEIKNSIEYFIKIFFHFLKLKLKTMNNQLNIENNE